MSKTIEIVNEIQERCFVTSARKGFHSTDTLRNAIYRALGEDVSLNSDEKALIDRILIGLSKDWEQMQHAKRLLLIVGEVSEAFEELRAGHEAHETYYKDGKPEGVPVELADVQIRLWDLAETMGISLQESVEEKQTYNEGRPHMHGKQF